ncbi:MAG: VTT domain-containing protein [Caldilineaceae bacterium]|nr:VTT domain-containing protein [Caldilineaceae bacterium]
MNWEQLLHLFGYPLIVLGIGLESMGLPTPGETLLLIGAALAANGKLNIYFVIVSAALGAILGDNLGYLLGRRHGRDILHRFVEFDEAKLARSEDFFKRHGPKAVFLARFIPIVRMFAAVLAGINHMPARTFAFYNAAGGLVWAIGMGSLGYFFGQNLPLIESWIRRIGAVVALLLVVGGVLFWLNRRWQRSERVFQRSVAGRLALGWRAGQRWVLAQGMGLGISIYLALFAASGWLFSLLVDAVVERDPVLAQLDRALTPWLRIGAGEVSTPLEGLVWLTDIRLLMAVSLLAALWQWRQGRQVSSSSAPNRTIAWLTIVNGFGALALGVGLQLWLRRPVPLGAEALRLTTGFSFPDLSALLSVAVYGWLVYIWSSQRSWQSRINGYTWLTFVLIAGGVTTLFLGDALLSDVLAGWALGLLWLGLPLSLLSWQTPVVASVRDISVD